MGRMMLKNALVEKTHEHANCNKVKHSESQDKIKEMTRARFSHSLQNSASNGQIVNRRGNSNYSITSCRSDQVSAYDSSRFPCLHKKTSLQVHAAPESIGKLKRSGLLRPSESCGNERSLKKKARGSPKDDTACIGTEGLTFVDDNLCKVTTWDSLTN